MGESLSIAQSWNTGAERKWEAPEHVLNIPMCHLLDPFGPQSYERLLCKPISSCDFLRACGKIAGHGVNKLDELLRSMGRMHRQAAQPALPAPPATGTHGGGFVPRGTWVIRGISTRGYTYVLNPSSETICNTSETLKALPATKSAFCTAPNNSPSSNMKIFWLLLALTAAGSCLL